MIPVPLFSGTFFVLLSLGLLALPMLLVWGVMLAFKPSVRQSFAQHRKKSASAFAVLLLLAGFSILVGHGLWSALRAHDREWRARDVVLEHASTIDQFEMPAGTRLQLLRPHAVDTFTSAKFPVATRALGLQVTQMQRLLRHAADGSQPYPVTMDVTLAQDQRVEGWHCAAAHPVSFDFSGEPRGTPSFRACHLAAGHRVDMAEVPMGTVVRRTGNTVYGDGAHDDDAWRLELDDEAADSMNVQGLQLRAAVLRVDEQHRLVGFSGVLAVEQAWRGEQYPAGLRVQRLGGTLRRRWGDALAFSPVEGQVLRRQGAPDVTPGHTLLRGIDGRTLGVVPNAEAGVMEFTVLRVN